MSVKILRQEERNQSPEYSVSWINRATYHYLQEIFSKGYKTPLEMDDLYKLDPENESVSIEKKFQEAWDRQQHRSGPIAKVFFAFSTAFGRDFYLAGVYLLIYNILNAVTPIVLQMLLQWLENPNDQIWIPYCLGVLLFALQLWAAFIYNWQYELAAKSGYRLRTGLSAALYQKFFKLSLASKQAFSVGKIVNIATTDTTRLDLTMQFVHMAWTSPVLIIIVCVILYLYLGVSGNFN
jgi:ABC-type bacteriocin/lantibiotic exporter with double-glycine peptidase domain